MSSKSMSLDNLIVVCLSILMAMTRFHHQGSAFHLPDASLAVFFLGGVFIGYRGVFLLFITTAVAIDMTAINVLGVSDYCLSPAYGLLIPSYGVMWVAGKWFSGQPVDSSWLVAGFQASGSVALSASVAFLISNAGFYEFSGKVSSLGWWQYVDTVAGQYPSYLGAAVGYALLGLGGAGAVKWWLRDYRQNRVETS